MYIDWINKSSDYFICSVFLITSCLKLSYWFQTEFVLEMRNINSKDKRNTMSLKKTDSSYLHLYLVLLTFLCIVKPAVGCGPGQYYTPYNSPYCFSCQPGRYQPNSGNYRTCTLCAAGKYSRYVSSTSTYAPTITATHLLIL